MGIVSAVWLPEAQSELFRLALNALRVPYGEQIAKGREAEEKPIDSIAFYFPHLATKKPESLSPLRRTAYFATLPCLGTAIGSRC